MREDSEVLEFRRSDCLRIGPTRVSVLLLGSSERSAEVLSACLICESADGATQHWVEAGARVRLCGREFEVLSVEADLGARVRLRELS